MSSLRFGAIATLVLVAGCRTEGDTVGKTTLTRADVDTVPCNEAIDKMTTRRCRNAERCAAKHHDASFHVEACTRDLRSHLSLELDRSTGCPEEVDRAALGTCLEAIDKDTCGRTVASLDQVVACRHSELCARAWPAPLQ